MNLISKTSNDDPSILHVEVGSGRAEFGKKFFSPCYLSDINPDLKNKVDVICSADSLPWGSDRFSMIIMANPFMYGFFNLIEGQKLLSELFRVGKPKSTLLIVTNKVNPYCMEEQLILTLDTIENVTYHLNIELDSREEIENAYPKHIFYRSDMIPAKPNRQYRIEFSK